MMRLGKGLGTIDREVNQIRLMKNADPILFSLICKKDRTAKEEKYVKEGLKEMFEETKTEEEIGYKKQHFANGCFNCDKSDDYWGYELGSEYYCEVLDGKVSWNGICSEHPSRRG